MHECCSGHQYQVDVLAYEDAREMNPRRKRLSFMTNLFSGDHHLGLASSVYPSPSTLNRDLRGRSPCASS